jgi:hypothetical protein
VTGPGWWTIDHQNPRYSGHHPDRGLTVVPGVAVRHRAAEAVRNWQLASVNVSIPHGMQEVRGSNPRSSTNFPRSDPDL